MTQNTHSAQNSAEHITNTRQHHLRFFSCSHFCWANRSCIRKWCSQQKICDPSVRSLCACHLQTVKKVSKDKPYLLLDEGDAKEYGFSQQNI